MKICRLQNYRYNTVKINKIRYRNFTYFLEKGKSVVEENKKLLKQIKILNDILDMKDSELMQKGKSIEILERIVLHLERPLCLADDLIEFSRLNNYIVEEDIQTLKESTCLVENDFKLINTLQFKSNQYNRMVERLNISNKLTLKSLGVDKNKIFINSIIPERSNCGGLKQIILNTIRQAIIEVQEQRDALLEELEHVES